MRIDVIGSGCARCRTLEERTRTALATLGLAAEIAHVTDPLAIAAAGVMRTPALAIDDEVVVVGRVPTVGALEALLRERSGAAAAP
jgi:small redox-active disulfide protein 2